MSNTYYIAKPLSIQSHKFAKGDVVGTGDVSKGQFTPAEGLDKIVATGHVIPRLADGRIVTEKPENDAPAKQTRGGKPESASTNA